MAGGSAKNVSALSLVGLSPLSRGAESTAAPPSSSAQTIIDIPPRSSSTPGPAGYVRLRPEPALNLTRERGNAPSYWSSLVGGLSACVRFFVPQLHFAFTSCPSLPRSSKGCAPNMMVARVLRSNRVKGAVRMQAEPTKAGRNAARRAAETMAKSLVANMSGWAVRLLAWLLAHLFRLLYNGDIFVDKEGLDRLKELKQRENAPPVVYLPTHKSYLDSVLLSQVLFANNLCVPHAAASADTLRLPFVGKLMRRSGRFFVRRAASEQNADMYRAVLSEYLVQLLSRGSSLEFFIEGGRSRDGKVGHAKLGLLSIAVEAVLENRIPDVMLQPLTIDYDVVVEQSAFIAEQQGSGRRRDTVWRVLRDLLAAARRPCSQAYVSFAKPMSLRAFIQANGGLRSTPALPATLNSASRLVMEVGSDDGSPTHSMSDGHGTQGQLRHPAMISHTPEAPKLWRNAEWRSRPRASSRAVQLRSAGSHSHNSDSDNSPMAESQSESLGAWSAQDRGTLLSRLGDELTTAQCEVRFVTPTALVAAAVLMGPEDGASAHAVNGTVKGPGLTRSQITERVRWIAEAAARGARVPTSSVDADAEDAATVSAINQLAASNAVMVLSAGSNVTPSKYRRKKDASKRKGGYAALTNDETDDPATGDGPYYAVGEDVPARLALYYHVNHLVQLFAPEGVVARAMNSLSRTTQDGAVDPDRLLEQACWLARLLALELYAPRHSSPPDDKVQQQVPLTLRSLQQTNELELEHGLLRSTVDGLESPPLRLMNLGAALVEPLVNTYHAVAVNLLSICERHHGLVKEKLMVAHVRDSLVRSNTTALLPSVTVIHRALESFEGLGVISRKLVPASAVGASDLNRAAPPVGHFTSKPVGVDDEESTVGAPLMQISAENGPEHDAAAFRRPSSATSHPDVAERVVVLHKEYDTDRLKALADSIVRGEGFA